MDVAEIPELRPVKSTNGRSLQKPPLALRAGIGLLERLQPSLTERLAAYLFCHPTRAAQSADEVRVFDDAHPFRLQACGHDLAAWSWGDGPTVLLHHGWSGRATHMAAFVRPLLDAGFSVVAYDAPAHGETAGRVTSAPEWARVLREVAGTLGGLYGVVAHSIGAAATLLAVRNGLKLQRAVLLAAPSDLRELIDLFADHLALSERTRAGMARRTAEWFRMEWSEMEVGHWAERELPPLLVVHDRNDAVVPWIHGERIRESWGNAELLTTQGLGHRRVRRDAEVIRRTSDFLSAGRSSPLAEEEAMRARPVREFDALSLSTSNV
jgi:pimeloyl-ACP methyl ester carboxylesterase